MPFLDTKLQYSNSKFFKQGNEWHSKTFWMTSSESEGQYSKTREVRVGTAHNRRRKLSEGIGNPSKPSIISSVSSWFKTNESVLVRLGLGGSSRLVGTERQSSFKYRKLGHNSIKTATSTEKRDVQIFRYWRDIPWAFKRGTMPLLKVMGEWYRNGKKPEIVNSFSDLIESKPSNSSSVMPVFLVSSLRCSVKLETKGQMEAANPKLPFLYGVLSSNSINCKEIKAYLGSGCWLWCTSVKASITDEWSMVFRSGKFLRANWTPRWVIFVSSISRFSSDLHCPLPPCSFFCSSSVDPPHNDSIPESETSHL